MLTLSLRAAFAVALSAATLGVFESRACAEEPAAIPEKGVRAVTAPGAQRVHLKITGAVQGVGFRDFTARAARELSVVGWVRNLPDGSVELVAEGKDDAVAELQKKVSKGPSGARVDGVTFLKVDAAETLRDFDIKISPSN